MTTDPVIVHNSSQLGQTDQLTTRLLVDAYVQSEQNSALIEAMLLEHLDAPAPPFTWRGWLRGRVWHLKRYWWRLTDRVRFRSVDEC